MTSLMHGTNTSQAEVTNVDAHGIWVLVNGREFFLPYEDYPWFKKASLEDVIRVELYHGVHLHWSALDVDLGLDSLEHPERYPMVAEN